jgi:hypothetical protein
MLSHTCPRCKSVRLQLGFDEARGLTGLLGFRGLLCNNCGLEFRRFVPAGRFERSQSDEPETSPNRRRAPRYRVRLRVRLDHDSKGRAGGESPAGAEADGYTRDLSGIGLAIIVPDAGAGRAFADARSGFRAWVELPSGAVKMHVVPVRHEELSAGPEKGGLLIGAHIRGIGELERAALLRYMESLQP